MPVGVKGAAWATILGQILNAAFFAACLFRFKTIKLKREYFIPKLQIARRLASLGVSSLFSRSPLYLSLLLPTICW